MSSKGKNLTRKEKREQENKKKKQDQRAAAARAGHSPAAIRLGALAIQVQAL
jgi:hypothetical protein